MRKILTTFFALALSVSSAFAGGTLTLMGVGPGNSVPPPASVNFGTAWTDATSTTSHSASCAIGTADAGRYVVAAFENGNSTVSAATIGGVSATTLFTGTNLSIIGANVPTGTSATVAYTTSGNSSQYGGCWYINDLLSFTRVDLKSSTTGATATLSPNTVSGGVVLGIVNGSASGLTITVSGTGITQDYTNIRSSSVRSSGGSGLTPSTGTTNVTTTWSATGSVPSFVAITWR